MRVEYPVTEILRSFFIDRATNRIMRRIPYKLKEEFPHLNIEAEIAYYPSEALIEGKIVLIKGAKIQRIDMCSKDRILEGVINHEETIDLDSHDFYVTCTFNYQPFESNDQEYRRIIKTIRRGMCGLNPLAYGFTHYRPELKTRLSKNKTQTSSDLEKKTNVTDPLITNPWDVEFPKLEQL